MKKTIMILGFLIGLILMSFVNATELPTCVNGTTTILSSGDYIMTSDMDCDLQNIDGANIYADDGTDGNYTLDCQGHTITTINGEFIFFDDFYASNRVFYFVNDSNSLTITNCNFEFSRAGLFATKENYDNFELTNSNITIGGLGYVAGVWNYDGAQPFTSFKIINNTINISNLYENAVIGIYGSFSSGTFEIYGNQFYLINVTRGIIEGQLIGADPLYIHTQLSGNYYDWSGYTCVDTTPRDGICDNPYSYDDGYYPEIIDLYPISTANGSIPPCTPDWSCDGYGSCLINDTQECNSVIDNNTCGENYTGDYSEFSPQACDYCTPDWSCDGYGSCLINDTQECNSTDDSNNCYAITSLPTDQYTGDYSEFSPQACDYCTPDWSCDGYGSCNISDLSPCNDTIDNNGCGDIYSGNYTEFTPQPCDYCSADEQLLSQTDCYQHITNLTYIDNNFATCCNVTLLGSDCLFGNESTNTTSQSCSLFDYSAEDLAPATIDSVLIIILTVIPFVALFVMLILWNVFFKQVYGKFK